MGLLSDYLEKKFWWLKGLTHKDWLIDGHPIKGEWMMEVWEGLDWGSAFCDPGPSPAGNFGPYWCVPFPAEGSRHRLYPKLPRKWVGPMFQAAKELTGKNAADYLDWEAMTK